MHNAFYLCSSSPSSCFSANLIRNIGEFGAKKYFTDHRAANAIQLYLFLQKRNFLDLFFFRTSRSEGEFPRGYLINIAPVCWHIIKIDISEQKPVYTVKILISEQTAFAAVPLLWTSFCFLQVSQ